MDPDPPRHLSVLDPRTGTVVEQRLHDPARLVLENPGAEPRLYVFTREPVAWET